MDCHALNKGDVVFDEVMGVVAISNDVVEFDVIEGDAVADCTFEGGLFELIKYRLIIIILIPCFVAAFRRNCY